MLKRAAAWFCLIAGALLNVELLLTAGRVNFVWLLLFAIAARYFQQNGLLRSRQQQGTEE